MTSLFLDLPADLILAIADKLDNEADISALGRTSRSLHGILTSTLYRHNAQYSHSSALRYGAIIGEIGMIQWALDNGADVEASIDRCNQLPARAHQKVQQLQLIHAGEGTRECLSPLACAALYGHTEAVQLLLDKGANTEAIDIWLRTPLFMAARTGHEQTVKLLLERGADTASKDSDGETALWPAIQSGNVQLVKFLLLDKQLGGGGFDVNAVPSTISQATLALAATHKSRNVDMIEALIETGADLANRNDEERDALTLSVKQGHIDNIRALLDRGATVTNRDYRAMTALSYAAELDRADVAELLLKHGADVEAQENGFGMTPLMLAAVHGDAVARVLVEQGGAKVDVADTRGRTALSYAARNSRVEVARMLIEQGGAAVDWTDHESLTPLASLMTASQLDEDAVKLTKLLLAHGAGVDGADNKGSASGMTPLAYLASTGRTMDSRVSQAHLEIARILLEAGADLYAKDSEGRTALSLAGQKAMGRYLVEVWEELKQKKGE